VSSPRRWELTSSNAPIDVSGGAGATPGTGGTVSVRGRDGTTVTGTLKANAGTPTIPTGLARAGGVQIDSDVGPTSVSGRIESSGVFGGGHVQLSGTVLHTNTTIVAEGAPVATQYGMGGQVTLLSRAGFTENLVAAPAGISVRGGKSNTAGDTAYVSIDGIFVTSLWTW
jgi:hypothetical protein